MAACTCSGSNSCPIAAVGLDLVWLASELTRCPSSHSTRHSYISNYPQAIEANYKVHIVHVHVCIV